MLTRVPGPKILSDACHEFSARIDLAGFDPERTPRLFGLRLPTELAKAVPSRQAEFLAGRLAALSALKEAGCADPGTLAPGPDRAPLWPRGFVGSITHVPGYVSAAVARSSRLRGIGRDTERLLDERTALEIRVQALKPEEIEDQAASGLPIPLHTGLIFSAKESLYKAIAPIARKYFDFQDALVIALDPRQGRMRLRLLTGLGSGFEPGLELDVRFEIGEHIHTAIELEAI